MSPDARYVALLGTPFRARCETDGSVVRWPSPGCATFTRSPAGAFSWHLPSPGSSIPPNRAALILVAAGTTGVGVCHSDRSEHVPYQPARKEATRGRRGRAPKCSDHVKVVVTVVAKKAGAPPRLGSGRGQSTKALHHLHLPRNGLKVMTRDVVPISATSIAVIDASSSWRWTAAVRGHASHRTGRSLTTQRPDEPPVFSADLVVERIMRETVSCCSVS